MWVFAFKAGFLNKFTNLKGENMNEERTFGVEMETLCKVSRDMVARELAVVLQPFGHTARSEGYNHMVDQTNSNVWQVKPDGSLRQSATREFAFDCEVVSPILKGTQGLEILKAVCDYMKRSQNFKIYKTCGLHVHHGVRANELKNIALTWEKIEKVIMKALPASRKMNTYCKPWHTMSRHWANSVEVILRDLPVLEWYRRFMNGDRYYNLNLASFNLRGTVEFRCAAGSFEYEKVANWLLATQAIIENSGNLPGCAMAGFDEFKAWLNSNGTRNSIPENGNASVFGNHRRNTASAMVDEMLREGIHLHEAIARLQAAFANYANAPKQAERKFKGHVCHLLQNNVNIQRTGTYYVYIHPAPHVPQSTQNGCSLYNEAIEWLQRRYAQFCNVEAAY